MHAKTDKLVKSCLLASIVEGMIAVIALLLIPTDPKNAWLYTYSKTRVGTILFVLVLIILLVCCWARERRNQGLRKKLVSTAIRLKKYGWLLHILFAFWGMFLIWGIFSFRLSILANFPPEILLMTQESMLRFLPVAIFGFLIILQFAAILIFSSVSIKTPLRPTSLRPISSFLRRASFVFGGIIVLTLVLTFNREQIARAIAREEGLLTYYSIFLLLTIALLALYRSFLVDNANERLFFRLMGIGFAYLAVDERFLVHEGLGDWVEETWSLLDLRYPHLDDFIIVIYLVIGLVFLFYFRSFLLRFFHTWKYLLWAFVFALLTILLDMRVPWLVDLANIYFDENFLEEATKVLSEFFIFLAFVQTYKE